MPVVKQALQDLGPISCVFYATWTRQANEHANCLANGAMFRNAVHAVAAARRATSTSRWSPGTKQYLGSFENYGATRKW